MARLTVIANMRTACANARKVKMSRKKLLMLLLAPLLWVTGCKACKDSISFRSIYKMGDVLTCPHAKQYMTITQNLYSLTIKCTCTERTW